MKNLYPPPAWHETPRTNSLIFEVQSTTIPFDMAFWRLLELTRNLEVENTKLQETQKTIAARQTKKKVVARKRQGALKAKTPRKF